MDEGRVLDSRVLRLEAELAAAHERCRACRATQERLLAQSEAEVGRLRVLALATPRVSDGHLLASVKDGSLWGDASGSGCRHLGQIRTVPTAAGDLTRICTDCGTAMREGDTTLLVVP